MSTNPRDEEEWRGVVSGSGYESPCGNNIRVFRETESYLEYGEVRQALKAVFGQDFSLDHDLRAGLVSESDLHNGEERKLLETVFAHDSASDLDEEGLVSSFRSAVPNRPDVTRWERVDEIQGLWLYRDFLTPEQQSRILLSIEKEKWFSKDSHNQAMKFGDLPEWVISLSNSIRELCLGCATEDSETLGICPFPMNLLMREPLFNQLIANVYEPGEGICAHVDLMRFEDGIAIVSLESSCVMHFTRVNHQGNIPYAGDRDASPTKIPVFLTPGSLVLLSSEARYDWMHEINRKPGFQVWDGKEIEQHQRTSITLRKLHQTE